MAGRLAPAGLKDRIDRRTFLSAASALGLSSAILPIGAPFARAAAPKKGGRLRVAITGGHTTDTLDPATFEDAFMQLAGLGCLYNCMTEIDAQGNLVPELAGSWESSADAKTWIFKLRQDVEFHNGKSLDAERCGLIDQPSSSRGIQVRRQTARRAD